MVRHALCIGINDYPGTKSDLFGCVNDANDWAVELRNRKFTTVTTLLDRSATKAAIVSAMRKLIATATVGDLVVLTYSGHGTWVPDESGDELDARDEALCPHDSTANQILTDDELYEIFSQRNAQMRLVFISDSCHSGSVARLAPRLSPDGTPRNVRFLPPATFLPESQLPLAKAVEKMPARGRSRATALLLSGCQDSELSYDASFGGRPNGAFTHAALGALRSLRAGATYRDWYRAIRVFLPSADFPQTPNLGASRAQREWKVFE